MKNNTPARLPNAITRMHECAAFYQTEIRAVAAHSGHVKMRLHDRTYIAVELIASSRVTSLHSRATYACNIDCVSSRDSKETNKNSVLQIYGRIIRFIFSELHFGNPQMLVRVFKRL